MMVWSRSKAFCPRCLSITAALVLGMAAGQTKPAWAEGPDLADFPVIVFCEYNGIGNLYYLSQIGQDGVAIYLTPDNQAARITVEGTPRVVGGDRSGSCANKTLDDLRASKQAFDLQR